MFKDYFLILEVHYLASYDVIKASYKALSKKHHPDQGGNKVKFHEINEAYDILSNSEKKRDYIKLWMENFLHQESFHMSELKESFYDITLFHIKKVLIAYLEGIQNKTYQDAYGYLSENNQKHLFLKDFIAWQRVIAEVHQILDFECFVDRFDRNDQGQASIYFKVRVKEYNHLLNRVEEDYFERILIYENNCWRVKLSTINIRSVIRKYRKIIALYKKNKKQFHQLLPEMEGLSNTKLVSKKIFLTNCEYEWLRYKRYKNSFSIMAIYFNESDHSLDLEEVISKETRDIDSFCLYKKSAYYLLLPETKKDSGLVIANKILKDIKSDASLKLSFKMIEVVDKYDSIKEVLNRLN